MDLFFKSHEVVVKQQLAHLFRLRDALDQMESDLGLGDLNDLERRVLTALGQGLDGKGYVAIRHVLDSHLLGRYSRASIYRSLKSLEEGGFIAVRQDESDARRSYVSIVEPQS